MSELADRIRRAWQGRISGCQLGKPVELLSMRGGYDALATYLAEVGAEAPRDYIGHAEHALVKPEWCAGAFTRSEPDDDVNYSVLALMMLEAHGADLRTVDVARHWLRRLPAGSTYTAERAAYRILMERGAEWFPEGADPGFDLAECADNPYSDWIGAQIRADLYGWVCPGDVARRRSPARTRSSRTSATAFMAPCSSPLEAALADRPLDEPSALRWRSSPPVPTLTRPHATASTSPGKVTVARIRARYEDLSPVATINNLALVTWALASHADDYSAAIGDVVAAGLDTDCNGATVGALWALQGADIPEHWTGPWNGRVGVSLAGIAELSLDDLVHRTVRVTEAMRA